MGSRGRPLLLAGTASAALLVVACGEGGLKSRTPAAPSPAPLAQTVTATTLIDGLVGDLLAEVSQEQEHLIRAETDAAVTDVDAATELGEEMSYAR